MIYRLISVFQERLRDLCMLTYGTPYAMGRKLIVLTFKIRFLGIFINI